MLTFVAHWPYSKIAAAIVRWHPLPVSHSKESFGLRGSSDQEDQYFVHFMVVTDLPFDQLIAFAESAPLTV